MYFCAECEKPAAYLLPRGLQDLCRRCYPFDEVKAELIAEEMALKGDPRNMSKKQRERAG